MSGGVTFLSNVRALRAAKEPPLLRRQPHPRQRRTVLTPLIPQRRLFPSFVIPEGNLRLSPQRAGCPIQTPLGWVCATASRARHSGAQLQNPRICISPPAAIFRVPHPYRVPRGTGGMKKIPPPPGAPHLDLRCGIAPRKQAPKARQHESLGRSLAQRG